LSLSVAKVASEPRPTLYSEHRAKGDPPVQSLREAELAMLSAGNYPAYLGRIHDVWRDSKPWFRRSQEKSVLPNRPTHCNDVLRLDVSLAKVVP